MVLEKQKHTVLNVPFPGVSGAVAQFRVLHLQRPQPLLSAGREWPRPVTLGGTGTERVACLGRCATIAGSVGRPGNGVPTTFSLGRPCPES